MSFLKSLVVALCVGVTVPVAADAPVQKVMRYAFVVAETSLDPVKINDLYSRTLTPHIFEALYQYDHLARPIRIKPLTADGMPYSQPPILAAATVLCLYEERTNRSISGGGRSSARMPINCGAQIEYRL